MRILALDLANKTGWAHDCTGGLIAGTFRLGTDKEIENWGKTRMNRRCDDRVCRLIKFIADLRPEAIVWEDVQFVKSTFQGQLWPSLRTAIWAYACSNKVLVECVPVQTLKKFATGKGGATKEGMCRALASSDRRFSARGETVFDSETDLWLDDNAVDAIWLWRWAKHNLIHE